MTNYWKSVGSFDWNDDHLMIVMRPLLAPQKQSQNFIDHQTLSL